MNKFLLIASMVGLLGSGFATASPTTLAPAAPPSRCEIRLSAWCIAEGAYEINRQLANDSVHDRVWSMRGRSKPASKVIVLEPNGCKSAPSDALELLEFEQGVAWQNDSWDRIQVKLKSDGSCDLTILLPPYDGDPLEWAFSSGLPLIRPCKDEKCIGAGIGELRSQFEKRYRERPKS